MVGEVVSGQEIFLTPAQYDELKQLDIQQHTELMAKLDKLLSNSDTSNLTLDSINNSILQTNDSIMNIPAVDNTILVSKMDEFITTINSLSDTFSWVGAASSTIVGYGVFYFPLVLIVLALWWFFKQFIR